ncbi:MAG: 1-(5-phosphoribosyl)-5-[(5-phosphoribosylamino)methylideneamino]imidazole-4-carboxamide isomerase [Oscillospiraceae bacterium]|nr:1-(5-phosphoribosyl)-5-[(5-phosphoribosylamino)methylideneamino]imidazole-4-carboxamide isomerase [Oscillospiraceae bacterium]
MLILPAIDLYEGKAVRLLRGNYADMTVYSDAPTQVAERFAEAGAAWVHMVDLAGARDGTTPNLSVVEAVARAGRLRVEIGGGIRSAETVARYLDAGVSRVILGTAALTEPGFAADMAARYGEAIAVGVDLRDGKIAIRGWTETAETDAFAFCAEMEAVGVKTLIVTDIAKDGAMAGTNRGLYAELLRRTHMNLIASGGVSSLEDVRALRDLGVHGAIVGKAYYTGAVDLRAAIQVAMGKQQISM